jgi:hypothetical protein
MEVDATGTTIPFRKLTNEEREKFRAEGHCFRCRNTGHMARNCPKNAGATSPKARESTTTTPATSPATTPTPPTMTIAQQIHALEDKMTDEERGVYLDARDMGEDFCAAGL